MGNFYGVTAYGGSGPCVLFGTATGCGTVFELSPPRRKGGAWTETVLYNFQGGNDGNLPNGSLVFDSKGNLYGATSFGGGQGSCNAFYGYCGTMFELSPPKQKGGQWAEKVLHSFAGIASGKQYGDGAEPNGGLVLDSKGQIYGTTQIGGYNCPQFQGIGCGTIFDLKPSTKKGGAWTMKILHSFTEGDDGGNPNGGPILDANGALYGTTGAGGTQDSGVVFRFTQIGGPWRETVLHNCQGTKDDSNPLGLLFDSLGNLYFSTGGIDQLKPPKKAGSNWSLHVLYSFKDSPDGRSPLALIFGPRRVLFGTTFYGGTGRICQGGCGAAFQVRP